MYIQDKNAEPVKSSTYCIVYVYRTSETLWQKTDWKMSLICFLRFL